MATRGRDGKTYRVRRKRNGSSSSLSVVRHSVSGRSAVTDLGELELGGLPLATNSRLSSPPPAPSLAPRCSSPPLTDVLA
jgi:hypothetical protein